MFFNLLLFFFQKYYKKAQKKHRDVFSVCKTQKYYMHIDIKTEKSSKLYSNTQKFDIFIWLQLFIITSWLQRNQLLLSRPKPTTCLPLYQQKCCFVPAHWHWQELCLTPAAESPHFWELVLPPAPPTFKTSHLLAQPQATQWQGI